MAGTGCGECEEASIARDLRRAHRRRRTEPAVDGVVTSPLLPNQRHAGLKGAGEADMRVRARGRGKTPVAI